jgi:hypothetical protein
LISTNNTLLHYIKYIYANRITRSKSALINRNRTDNPTVFVQVEETDDVTQELISDLAEFRAEIKELRAKVEEFLAFMKGLVSI